MPAPPTPIGAIGQPTGNARFRKDWRGRLVLECEFSIYKGDSAMGERPLIWRDAPHWALSHIRHHRKARGLDPLI
jgi:hypothetical protein